MKRFFLIPLVILVVGGLIFGGCAQPAPAPTPTSMPPPFRAPSPTTTPEVKPIELRFGHQNPPVGTTTEQFLNPWAKKIEEATKGRVKVTMYPSESLFKANEAVEAAIGGVTDIAWTILGYYPGRYPLTTITTLPYLNLPSGKVDGRAVSVGGINSYILQKLYETVPEIQAEYKDVKLLFLHTGDPPTLFTSKRPIYKVADLKGLKIRDLGGYVAKWWQRAGTSVVLLPMPDIYAALEKGVIDGTVANFSPMGANRFYEILKYYSNLTSGIAQFEVIMNLRTWNSLPPDIQEAIMSVSGTYGAEFAGTQAYGPGVRDAVLAQAQKAGHPLQEIVMDPGELEKMKQLALPLYDEWVAEMEAKGLPGKKILDEALRLIEKYRG